MLRIELLVGLDDAYGRAVARGVIRYAKAKAEWKLYGYGRLLADPRELESGGSPRPDGIIARAESPAEARELARLGLPVVDVAGAYVGAGLREANNDDFEAGRRAGEYLRALGFKRFAFCGVEGTAWSRLRLRGFAEAAGIAERALPRFERPLAWWRERPRGTDELASWLGSVPVPTALFACNDVAGLKVAETCRGAGFAVPADIAVLGVDDEDLLCELADPSLSSVRLDCEGIGMAAAAMLDAALGGQLSAPRARLVSPLSVVERESTRVVVSDDPLVAAAATWIRANAQLGLGAADLVAALPASRRSIEKRFRAATGATIREAIEEARLDRAKRLLAASELPLDSVAEASGFGSLQRFHFVFKTREGVSPGAWRRAGR